MKLGRQFFDNGYGVSVICNEFSYGGREGLMEIAVLQGTEGNYTLTYDTPVTDDVIGYLTDEEAESIVEQVKALPPWKEETNED